MRKETHFGHELGLEKGPCTPTKVAFDTTPRAYGSNARVLTPLLFLARLMELGLGLGL